MSGKDQESIVGIHIDMEEPKNPNLVLYNDGTKAKEEQVEAIFRKCIR